MPTWTQQGPAPITGGQVAGLPSLPVTGGIEMVATHPTNPNIVYVGTVGGGVWRTSNALAGTDGLDSDGDGRIDELDEVKWTALTEEFPSSSISALAVDPSDPSGNTLIAGTGRVSSSILDELNVRAGLFRTTDGGATWTVVRDPDVLGKTVFAILPLGTGNVVLVGTEGERIGREPNNVDGGLLRSTDGGLTFTKISGNGLDTRNNDNAGAVDDDPEATGLPSGSVTDLELDPANKQRIYAGMPGRWLQPGLTFNQGDVDVADAGATANTIRIAGHNLGAAGTVVGRYRLVNFDDNPTAPGGLGFGIDYDLKVVDADHVQVSLRGNAATIDLTSAGNGNMALVRLFDFAAADVNTGTNRITIQAHGLKGISGPFRISADPAGNLPTGLTTGTDYYLHVIDANTVEVRESATGAAVVLGTQGAGIHIFNPINGLFRSENGGQTWVPMSKGIPDVILARANKVEMTVSAAVDPATGEHPIYAAFLSSGTLSGIFRSADRGVTWTQMTLPGDADGGIHPGSQSFNHTSFVADPLDPNVVYIGGDRQAGNFPNATGANDFSGRLFRGDARLGVTSGIQLTFGNNGANDTITRAAGSWFTDGFHVGDTLSVKGSLNFNDGNYTVQGIDATGTVLALTLNGALGAGAENGVTVRNTTLGVQWVSLTDNRAQGTAPHADSRTMRFDSRGNIYEVDDGGVYRLVNPIAFVNPTRPGAPAVLSLNPGLAFNGTNITRGSGSWTDDGFVVNQRIFVTGSARNDGSFTITNIDATGRILTLSSAVQAEAANANQRIGVVGVATLTGNPNLTFTESGAADTITRAAGSWITDGFRAGMQIQVTGAAAGNNGTFTIVSINVAGTVLTLAAENDVADGLPAAANITVFATPTQWQSVNGNLNLTELYAVAYDAASGSILGGAQDVGTPLQSVAGTLQQTISFAIGGGTVLDAGDIAQINNLAVFLVNNPQLAVEIGGHSDSGGSAAANLLLSRQRAQAVADQLVTQGVSASRLRVVGYGEVRPLPGTNAADAANRRVEVKTFATGTTQWNNIVFGNFVQARGDGAIVESAGDRLYYSSNDFGTFSVTSRVADLRGAPQLTFTNNLPGTNDTITRASGSWIDDGFIARSAGPDGAFNTPDDIAGYITVTGAGANDGMYRITAVTALTLTVEASDNPMTTQVVPGAGVTITGYRATTPALAVNNTSVGRLTGSPTVTFADTAVNMAGNPNLTFNPISAAGPATIVRSAGSWRTDGFTAGMNITFAGAGLLNNGTFTVDAIDAAGTTLTLIPSQNVNTEAAAAGYAANGIRPTLTRSSGSYLTDGFRRGQEVVFVVPTANPANPIIGTGTIADVTATRLVLLASHGVTGGSNAVVMRSSFVLKTTSTIVNTGGTFDASRSGLQFVQPFVLNGVQAALTGNPTLTFALNGAAADTIVRSAGSWTADGFVVGQRITVSGSTTTNNRSFTIAAITNPTTLQLIATDAVAAEAAHADFVVTGADRMLIGTGTRGAGAVGFVYESLDGGATFTLLRAAPVLVNGTFTAPPAASVGKVNIMAYGGPPGRCPRTGCTVRRHRRRRQRRYPVRAPARRKPAGGQELRARRRREGSCHCHGSDRLDQGLRARLQRPHLVLCGRREGSFHHCRGTEPLVVDRGHRQSAQTARRRHPADHRGRAGGRPDRAARGRSGRRIPQDRRRRLDGVRRRHARLAGDRHRLRRRHRYAGRGVAGSRRLDARECQSHPRAEDRADPHRFGRAERQVLSGARRRQAVAAQRVSVPGRVSEARHAGSHRIARLAVQHQDHGPRRQRHGRARSHQRPVRPSGHDRTRRRRRHEHADHHAARSEHRAAEQRHRRGRHPFHQRPRSVRRDRRSGHVVHQFLVARRRDGRAERRHPGRGPARCQSVAARGVYRRTCPGRHRGPDRTIARRRIQWRHGRERTSQGAAARGRLPGRRLRDPDRQRRFDHPAPVRRGHRRLQPRPDLVARLRERSRDARSRCWTASTTSRATSPSAPPISMRTVWAISSTRCRSPSRSMRS